jgi:hypothetical protein
MFLAEVYHPHIETPHGLEFVIDTGAEMTLIVPYWEQVLNIRKGKLLDNPYEIDTIGGKISLACLPHCSIVFLDVENKPYPVHDVSIHFFSEKQKRKKTALMGEPVYPNVIGRDVLTGLSLGYCQTSKYLFVTKEIGDYKNVLKQKFPPPKNEVWLPHYA